MIRNTACSVARGNVHTPNCTYTTHTTHTHTNNTNTHKHTHKQHKHTHLRPRHRALWLLFGVPPKGLLKTAMEELGASNSCVDVAAIVSTSSWVKGRARHEGRACCSGEGKASFIINLSITYCQQSHTLICSSMSTVELSRSLTLLLLLLVAINSACDCKAPSNTYEMAAPFKIHAHTKGHV